MKYKLILFASFILALLSACEKDENKVYFEGGTVPVLTASTNATASTINLNFDNKDKEAVRFSWTNPDYSFNTGVSSQNVNYQVEIDTVGANFTNPKRKVITVPNDLGLGLTTAVLNDYLLNQLELKPAMAHNLEIRVKSTLTNNQAALTSNVLKFTTTPYAIPPKVETPKDGTLWITGSATPSGWSNPLPAPYDVAQQFTKVSDTKYELVVDMVGAGGYKLIQKQGDWSSQYSFKSGDAMGGEFEKADATQFNGPAAAGKYKITVDFQTGKFSLAQQ